MPLVCGWLAWSNGLGIIVKRIYNHYSWRYRSYQSRFLDNWESILTASDLSQSDNDRGYHPVQFMLAI